MTPTFPPDFLDLAIELNRADARYLPGRRHAVAVHGRPRPRRTSTCGSRPPRPSNARRGPRSRADRVACESEPLSSASRPLATPPTAIHRLPKALETLPTATCRPQDALETLPTAIHRLPHGARDATNRDLSPTGRARDATNRGSWAPEGLAARRGVGRRRWKGARGRHPPGTTRPGAAPARPDAARGDRPPRG